MIKGRACAAFLHKFLLPLLVTFDGGGLKAYAQTGCAEFWHNNFAVCKPYYTFARQSTARAFLIHFNMQAIQKFHVSEKYYCENSKKLVFELVEREKNYLIFRVRNLKTRDSFKIDATSFYKADELGAFEEVMLSDGSRLRAKAA